MKPIWLRCGLAALALLFSLSGAYAAENKDQATMPLVYNADALDAKPVWFPKACMLNIVSVSDRRRNTENVSVDHALATDPPSAWIRSGLDGLKVYGFKVQHSDKPVPEAINLDLGVTRAYAWESHMRINGTVAMDVGITPPGGERRVQKFRASGSKTNMVGADSEYLTALNYALNNLLRKMAFEMNAVCVVGSGVVAK